MTLMLELPPDLEQRVRAAAERGGFATAQDYIFDLVAHAVDGPPGSATHRSRPRSRRRASGGTVPPPDAGEAAAMEALLSGDLEIPPPIPFAEIRGARPDVRLVREIRGGEPYEYYPVGEYIVSAPGVCGGRLTFKYTRLDARWVLAYIEAGENSEDVARDYRLASEAVQELLRLAGQNERDVFERSVIPPDSTG